MSAPVNLSAPVLPKAYPREPKIPKVNNPAAEESGSGNNGSVIAAPAILPRIPPPVPTPA